MEIEQLVNLLRTGDYGEEPSLESIHADKRTWRDIPLAPLETLLAKHGVFIKLEAIASNGASETDKAKIASFLRFASSPRQTAFPSTDPLVASQTADVVALLLAEEPQLADVAEQMFALGGGLRVPEPVTQGELDDAIARMGREDEAKADLKALTEEWNAKLNRHAHRLDEWKVTGEGPKPSFDWDEPLPEPEAPSGGE